jgi:hypothetical protein
LVAPALLKLLLLWYPLHLQEVLQEALQVQVEVEVHHWAEEEEGPL